MTEEIYKALRLGLRRNNHRLLLDIAYHTGEPWRHILSLGVEDVYSDLNTCRPADRVTFRRFVPMPDELAWLLSRYTPPEEGWLFPSDITGDHLTIRAVDNALRRAIARAGLGDMGITTYSTRLAYRDRLLPSDEQRRKAISLR